MITDKCYKYLSLVQRGTMWSSPSGIDEDFSGSNTVQAHFRFWSSENFTTSGFYWCKVLLPVKANSNVLLLLLLVLIKILVFWFWTEYLHAGIFKLLSKTLPVQLNINFYFFRPWCTLLLALNEKKYACSLLSDLIKIHVHFSNSEYYYVPYPNL
jgi:hypothetical protein